MGKRGRSSVVERQLPKLNVVGSIPIARSNRFNDLRRLTGRSALVEGHGAVVPSGPAQA